MEVFKEIKFNKMQINNMDEGLLKFPNLEILELNNNLVKTIQNIPSSLKELHLFSNSVSKFSPKLKDVSNL